MQITPSQDELIGIGLAAADTARSELLLDEGDISEQLVVAAAAMGVAVLQYANRRARQTYLEGCDDRATLVQRIMDRHNLPPLEAAAAAVTVTFTRATATAGAGSVGAGFVVATAIDSEGKRYEFTTDSPVSFGALETGTKSVAATASAQGTGSNVAAGTITQAVSALFDTSIVITNPAVAAGGADDESSADYIARARQYPQRLARGTAGAVELAALSVPGVRTATAVENEASGLATLFIADGSGNSNAELVLRVILELENWRALGANIAVTGGVKTLVDVGVTLTMRFGSPADVAGLVQDAISDEMAKNGGGETQHLARLVAAMINAAPDRIKNAIITTPAADVQAAENEILRAGAVTVS